MQPTSNIAICQSRIICKNIIPKKKISWTLHSFMSQILVKTKIKKIIIIN